MIRDSLQEMVKNMSTIRRMDVHQRMVALAILLILMVVMEMLFPIRDVHAQTQTRYFRGDEQLLIGNGGGDDSLSYPHPHGRAVYWEFKVFKRHGGTDTELTNGWEYHSYRSSSGEGVVSRTWNCPQTSMETTDKVLVQVRMCIYEESGTTPREFVTDELGASQLNSNTWTIYLYTKLDFEQSIGYFYYGPSYNSRIEGFEFTAVIVTSSPTAPPPTQKCIIATVAYGEMEPEISYIRYVRDERIGASKVGRILVDCWNDFYYSWSPQVASSIAHDEMMKMLTRVILFPLIAIIHISDSLFGLLLPFNADLASILAFGLAASLATFIYIGLPILLSHRGLAFVCARLTRRSNT